MLKSRIYQLKLAQRDTRYSGRPKNKFFIWDRSMIGDYIFALWNHLQGSISKQEMEVYESEFGGSFRKLEDIPFLKDIHCFVWLNDEPANCKWRVEHQRNNESEKGIPLPYYEGIDDIHYGMFMELLAKKISKVVVMNWGEFNDAEVVHEHLSAILSGRKSTGSVTYNDNLQDRPSDSLLYSNEEEILDAYNKLKLGQDFLPGDWSSCEVFIPLDIMTIEPQAKQVISTDYPLNFYKNEYKRVVLWHLSRAHNITLYHSH